MSGDAVGLLVKNRQCVFYLQNENTSSSLSIKGQILSENHHNTPLVDTTFEEMQMKQDNACNSLEVSQDEAVKLLITIQLHS